MDDLTDEERRLWTEMYLMRMSGCVGRDAQTEADRFIRARRTIAERLAVSGAKVARCMTCGGIPDAEG